MQSTYSRSQGSAAKIAADMARGGVRVARLLKLARGGDRRQLARLSAAMADLRGAAIRTA